MNLEEENKMTESLKEKKKRRPKKNSFSKHLEHLLRALGLQT